MNNEIIVHIPDEKLLELIEIPKSHIAAVENKESRIKYGYSIRDKAETYVYIECKILIEAKEKEELL